MNPEFTGQTMNFPLEIGYNGISISAHLVFETLAFVLGFRYYLYLRRNTQDPISEGNRLWLIIGAAFGAFFFSRLLGALEDPYIWWQAKHPFLHFFQSKTLVGGLLGGLLGVEMIKIWMSEKQSSGDLFTFPLILGIMIGRIGCFSSGIYEATYGIETDLPWGMDLGDGKARHPVALYEMIFLGLLWMVLKNLRGTYPMKRGIIFQYFMIVYLIFRFFLDFIKPGFRFSLGIGSIQIACLLGLLYYRKTIYLSIFHFKKLLQNE